MTGYFRGGSNRPEPMIRILLVHDVEKANLEVRGPYSIVDPNPEMNSFVPRAPRYADKSRYLEVVSDGLKWGEAFPAQHQVKFIPENSNTYFMIDGQPYQGFIYAYEIPKSYTLSIVNEIPIDEYVRSILIPFQKEQYEQETFNALAILARTNAYYQAMNPKTNYWAVDAQKVGFSGLAQGNRLIDNVVSLTRNMIMSRTGNYEGVATPFPVQFQDMPLGQSARDAVVSKITIDEANEMAKKGAHAAQILAKAFPGSTIMLINN
ncbi:MAG: SpoIID/LytB domain-containing protein [Parachlamydiaceae bacterium]|nr:SpoIID/LytB domain-containing protein [Parachlamydiaceae bacterium]